MNGGSEVHMRWSTLAVVAGALGAVGAGLTYLVLRPNTAAVRGTAQDASAAGRAENRAATQIGVATPVDGVTGRATVKADGERTTLPDVTVTLTPDAVERAGITVAPVVAGAAAAALRLPGILEPNAYRQVVVTPLLAGRITRVLVALGDRVTQGQAMAEIFSPELAEAETRFISARAELAAHEQELKRTERLVEIGAASRQELERIHAGHTAQTADVQSARSRLSLLGMPDDAIENLAPGTALGVSMRVPAPIGGDVTERLANVGFNVDPATRLFTVVDLSSLWVVADVHERDIARVRVGSPATVTTTAYPDMALQGRISYIDPQLSPDTRTAKVRVEVPNARGELRMGMYADVVVTSAVRSAVTSGVNNAVAGADQPSGVVIPKSAVQEVGDRHVVYLANPQERGMFIEREVRLGPSSGDQQTVVSGVQMGDVVVTSGSFFVRAERERLGLRSPGPTSR